LPPKIAPYQFVVVPVYLKEETVNQALNAKGNEIITTLSKLGVRGFLDSNDTHNAGWKYNHWELKGVPLRIDIGQRDLQGGTVVISRRDNFNKTPYPMKDLEKIVPQLLKEIQQALFDRAKKHFDEHVKRVLNFEDFMKELDDRNLVLSPFCDVEECEDQVKDKSGTKANDPEALREKEEYEKKKAAGELPESLPLTGAAKSLCKPLVQPTLENGTKCFNCGKLAKVWCLWGRSY